MAYIEENMKLRRARERQSTDTDVDAPSTAVAGARPNKGNAQDDVFDKLDPRYKVERKVGEEGSVTNSLAMLSAIPEVDLGMECVPIFPSFPPRTSDVINHLSPFSIHTARACEISKRPKRPSSRSRTDALATATKCQPTKRISLPRAVCLLFIPSLFTFANEDVSSPFLVYRPALRAKSDEDIIRDAKREALGLPPAHEQEGRPRGPQLATDEQVMERFKKRMRK
jgi:hypothetical protein